MKTYKVVKLKFDSPFHLSQGKPNYEDSATMLHSDTIKSALCVMAMQLYGLKNDKTIDFGEGLDIDKFFGKFKCSSAFPYYREEYFFPKPMMQLPFKVVDENSKDKEENEAKRNKALKKLTYIGKSLFEEVVKGMKEYEIKKEEAVFAKGKFYSETLKDLNENERENFKVYTIEAHRRVSIPIERYMGSDKDATPFFMEKIYFQEGAGLYFLVDIDGQADNDFWKKVFLPALRLWADSGIGAHKNLGHGRFAVEVLDNFELNVPTDADCSQMNLSLYCPIKSELQVGGVNILKEKNTAYSLIKRGGWVANPKEEQYQSYRKKSVYMFDVGSIFKTNKAPNGKVVNLKPQKWIEDGVGHDIFRDGTAIFVPIKV